MDDKTAIAIRHLELDKRCEDNTRPCTIWRTGEIEINNKCGPTFECIECSREWALIGYNENTYYDYSGNVKRNYIPDPPGEIYELNRNNAYEWIKIK